jgi:hypothetical protein
MPKVEMSWVLQQLTEKKTKKASGDAAIKLLDLWNTLELTEEQAKATVECFSKLSLGEPLVVPVKEDEVWIEARPGNIVVGEEVIVKPNAYTNQDLSIIHNGRRGKVVAVRYGDIIVKYTDGKNPEINDSHHSPHSLLKLLSNK